MRISSLKLPLFYLALMALLATQPGASCVSDTSSGDDSSSREPVNKDDPNEIPRRAVVVTEGRGPIDYTADADGDVYVQDLKDETTVVTHRIHRGEKVSVTPDDNRVRLEDDSIYKGDLKKDHVHRIYLLRDRRFDDRNTRDDNRNDRNDNLTPITINSKDKGPYGEKGVPKDARMMDQGMGREMTFVTSVDGRVFVFDVKNDRVVATPEIDARQVFKFSPGIDRITIDDKKVGRYDFDPNSQYRIYFSHQ